jgi:hypothetical protein
MRFEPFEPDDEYRGMALAWVMQDPIAFQEFFFPDEDQTRAVVPDLSTFVWTPGDGMELCWSQFPLVLWNVIVALCGRGIGKTMLSQRDYSRRALVYRNSQISVMMHNQETVETQHMEKVAKLFAAHPLLRHLFRRKNTHGKQIEFHNGSLITFLGPGRRSKADGDSNTARGVQGFRTTFAMLDESQHIEAEQYTDFLQTMNALDPYDPEHQRNRGAGFKMTGVPNGRGDTPFGESLETMVTSLSVERDGLVSDVLVSRVWQSPSAAVWWTRQSKHDKIDVPGYKCRPAEGIWTDKYRTDYWGMNSKSAIPVFPSHCLAAVSRAMTDWKHVELHYRDFHRHSEFDAHGRWLTTDWDWLRGQLPPAGPWRYVLGVDPGETSLTPIQICHEEPDPELELSRWVWQGCVGLREWRGHVFEQNVLLAFLYDFYRPMLIGVDATGWGSSFLNSIKTDPRFDTDVRESLVELHYSSKMVVRYEVDQVAVQAARTDWQRAQARAKRVPVEEIVSSYTMEELAERVRLGWWVFPNAGQAPEMHKQFGAMTRQLATGQGGRQVVKYLPAHPHFVSAMQMAQGAIRKLELSTDLQRGRSSQPTFRMDDLVFAMKSSLVS